MSEEPDFRRFFKEAFPAVSQESRAKVKSYLVGDKPLLQWMYKPSTRADGPLQGDIVDGLPLYRTTTSGVKAVGENLPAILLEHTCDMVMRDGAPRAKNYAYAPLFPFEKISAYMRDVSTLKRNLITHKIHMGAVPGLDGKYVADLNMTCHVRAESFHEAFGDSVKKATSLSNNGFFFVLAKLSAHFLRSDDRLDHPDR